ncbi:co-chaperone YbbN [Bifidobacterium primatium]|uniref:Co-chaperone YbbN n=2 Tax=Bifidobacterium TaxID=1678 RepID=A0A2M9HB19_9BIFI|nr:MULTISPECIES: tetratricopeptide repeat protein [Bifidobacterium]NEG95280.1 tetratricopeptide repeat protein [Bifidobacterium sp. SMB2]NEH11357.1 tetratricopeptide repeat protein [Bifidobacterium saimiriisciurei]PJM73981.1 co-chaperone YbbN [Bifidobacterium primatium]
MAEQPKFNPGLSLAGAVDLEALKHKVDAEAGEAGGAPAAGGYVIDTDESTFQAMVQTSATFPILLLLWVTNDDRCFDVARKLGDAVNKLEGKIQLSRIDIAKSPTIAQALQAQGAPAIYGLVGGRPMPIMQGVPSDAEMEQITGTLIPQIIQMAQQAGVTGTAPYQEAGAASEGADAAAGKSAEEQIPPEHQKAHQLAQEGDYAGAAVEYAKLMEADPNDARAAREHAKALLLARSAEADVRTVRAAAADNPDDVEAQLAVADIDMIGGQIEDAFSRLLDFLAGHKADVEPVRKRLLEYFAIPAADDARVARARRRLATLMY